MTPRTRTPGRARLAAVLVAGLACTAPVGTTQAQVSLQGAAAGRLTISTTVPAARDAYLAGMSAMENVFPSRARRLLADAVRLDPAFGLARVLAAGTATGLSPAERAAELSRGVADAARQSTGELLLAAGYRELYSGRAGAAAPIFRAAAELMPDDPRVAFRAAMSAPVAERPSAVERVVSRFPDFSPAYNSLAYMRLAAGDRAGALAAAEEQVKRAPDVPNAHDSYAEILTLGGRMQDAAPHYARAVELAPDYIAGHVALAMLHQRAGRGDLARAQLVVALRHAAGPADSATAMLATAGSYVADGRAPDALPVIGSVARLAEARGLPAEAARAHRYLARLDAQFGQGKAIDAHLAAAARLDTATLANARASALAHAVAGHDAAAQPAIAQLAALGEQGDSTARGAAHLARGALLLRTKQAAAAVGELSQVDTANVYALALLADAQRAAGRTAEARATRERVLADVGRDLDDLNFALALASRRER